MTDLIITGTGRCGTTYMAKVLNDNGFSCLHEQVYGLKYSESLNLEQIKKNEEKVKSIYTELPNGESSWMAVPFLKQIFADNKLVIHIVRNPKKVIDARVNNFSNNKWWEYIHKCIPELNKYQSSIEKSCLHYIRWNQLIEQYKDHPNYIFHRIEDGDQCLVDKVNSKLGMYIKLNNKISKKTNTSRVKRSNCNLYEDIKDPKLRHDILEMAKHYNYLV